MKKNHSGPSALAIVNDSWNGSCEKGKMQILDLLYVKLTIQSIGKIIILR